MFRSDLIKATAIAMSIFASQTFAQVVTCSIAWNDGPYVLSVDTETLMAQTTWGTQHEVGSAVHAYDDASTKETYQFWNGVLAVENGTPTGIYIGTGPNNFNPCTNTY